MRPLLERINIGKDGFSIYWFDLSFMSKDKERNFRNDYFKKSLLTVRICIVTTMILVAGFAYLDYLLSKTFIGEFIIVRFLILEPFMFLLLLFSFHKNFRKVWQELMFLFFVVCGAGIVYMIILYPQNLLHYGGILLIIMGGFFFSKLRFKMALFAGLVLIAIFTISAFITQMDRIHLFVSNSLYLSSILIGALALYNIEYLERKEFHQKIMFQAKQNELEKEHYENIKQHEEMNDSILYAKKIQRAIIPPDAVFSEALLDHFVLYKPKDIVSGDFYWIKRVKHFVFIAVADCTGHGVPGAFMSMLGISFLNETVSSTRLDSTGEILNRLRNRIKSSLHQSLDLNYQNDGIDMALIKLDTQSFELQYSGAYNPVVIIRDKKLHEIKADKQPIAHYYDEKTFTTHNYELKKGDAIYAYSDGYMDQFGGPKRKKMMARRFKNILIEVAEKPMQEQKSILENRFLTWKGGNEQVDDILVMGIRV